MFHIADDHPFDIPRNTHYHRVCPVENANVTFNLLSNALVENVVIILWILDLMLNFNWT